MFTNNISLHYIIIQHKIYGYFDLDLLFTLYIQLLQSCLCWVRPDQFATLDRFGRKRVSLGSLRSNPEHVNGAEAENRAERARKLDENGAERSLKKYGGAGAKREVA